MSQTLAYAGCLQYQNEMARGRLLRAPRSSRLSSPLTARRCSLVFRISATEAHERR